MTTTSSARRIEVTGVSKSYNVPGHAPTRVLDLVDLSISEGEFVSIIGPSGCGKSTLFNIVAGLDTPDTGEITLAGQDAVGHREHFAYMPQKDLLLPWRRIVDNAALGLQVQGMTRRRARERAAELFPAFGLSGFERAWPHQLSGGMRQRVALLRTVLQHRDVLLLDEPFGALDSLTRTEMQMWLMDVWQRYRWTVVLITHDIREAVLLSDRVYALGPRPARVRSVHEIDLPRPRSPAVLGEQRAARLELELLNALGPQNASSS